ncbi:MAG: hypothetical protein AMK69_25030 [Nitrospira bacterium SG8_3]|nr:MAG: hypothetical protein AMK69_25030 [Nitrospira bacterium SG8_3]
MKTRRQRKRHEKRSWVDEHLALTRKHAFGRVPLPEKGEHVVRRGRKTTGQGWSLIAGLPKERRAKGQRLRQNIPGSLT